MSPVATASASKEIPRAKSSAVPPSFRPPAHPQPPRALPTLDEKATSPDFVAVSSLTATAFKNLSGTLPLASEDDEALFTALVCAVELSGLLLFRPRAEARGAAAGDVIGRLAFANEERISSSLCGEPVSTLARSNFNGAFGSKDEAWLVDLTADFSELSAILL
jgi:hypothetical protein